MAKATRLPSPSVLEQSTVRQLGLWATRLGLTNWRSLRKAELIKALVKLAEKSSGTPKNVRGSAGRSAKGSANKKSVANRARHSSELAPARRGQTANHSTTGRPPSKRLVRASVASRKSRAGRDTEAREKPAAKQNLGTATAKIRRRRLAGEDAARIQELLAARERQMDLSSSGSRLTEAGHAGPAKDRIVLLVRDSYWLQATWDITRNSVERARAAMAEAWHTARPILRLYELEADATTSAAERVERDIDIHGSVRNWYIDVRNPPRKFRVEIGYLAATGRFYSLARSNTVTTPTPGITGLADAHWSDVADDYERIYALSGGYADEHVSGDLQQMFEDRLRRPMGSASTSRFGMPTDRLISKARDFQFEIDVEAIIFGRTKPNAQVTISGEPVKVKDDGTFTVRMNLPDRRQVLPIVACTPDGSEQRTIVLAIERNTKIMEPIVHEPTD